MLSNKFHLFNPNNHFLLCRWHTVSQSQMSFPPLRTSGRTCTPIAMPQRAHAPLRPPRHHPCVALTRNHSMHWLKTKLFYKRHPVGKLPHSFGCRVKICKVACHVRTGYCRPGTQNWKSLNRSNSMHIHNGYLHASAPILTKQWRPTHHFRCDSTPLTPVSDTSHRSWVCP